MLHRLDIAVPRNADYFEQWQMLDNVGEVIDLTGHTLELYIRNVAGQGSVIAAGTIVITEPQNGIYAVFIDGASLAGIAGSTELVKLAYDIRHTYPDGVQFIPVCGQIILIPGVTY